jgi:type II secretion system protein I
MIARPAAAARPGLTLLEVLVALGIFVAAIAVLSRLLLIGQDAVEYAFRQAEGTTIVENRFAELDAGLLTPAATSGQTDPDFPGWQWSMETSAGSNYLVKVKVSAERTASGAGRGFTVAMSRMFFDAASAQTAADQRKQDAAAATSSTTSSTTSGTGAAAASGGS